MSCRELIESLRKAADERVRLLWQEAESQADAARADVARRLDQVRADIDRKKAAAARDKSIQLESEAKSRARILRLSSERALADRLRQTAAASLPALRKGAYENAFGKMTRELPDLAWQTVRVNPGDEALGKKYFPGAEIIPDKSITGGMDASAADGTIRVINTFEKRLERAWDDMLPGLIRDAYREATDGTPAAT